MLLLVISVFAVKSTLYQFDLVIDEGEIVAMTFNKTQIDDPEIVSKIIEILKETNVKRDYSTTSINLNDYPSELFYYYDLPQARHILFGDEIIVYSSFESDKFYKVIDAGNLELDIRIILQTLD